MKNIAFRLLLALALTTFAAACGSDDDEKPSAPDVTQDTAPGEDTAPAEDADPGVDTAPDTDATEEEDTTEEPLITEDACLNDEDYEIIMDSEVDQTAIATNCALANLAEDDEDVRFDLVVTCVQDGTELSRSCSGCYGGIVSCTIANCLTPPANCAANPSGENCVECRDENCGEAFATCSGDTENYTPGE